MALSLISIILNISNFLVVCFFAVGSTVEDLSGDPVGMGSRINREGIDGFNTGPGVCVC